MAGPFYFLNFYSFGLSISWTYFPFYTLLTVAGVSRTDDLLCAQLKTIYFYYLSEASLSILHIVFLDSLRLSGLPAGITAGVLNFGVEIPSWPRTC